MRKHFLRRWIQCVVFLMLICLSVATVSGFAVSSNSDLTGHWAETIVKQWIARGDASGYPDGHFRPDKTVTRAEFIKWVNRVVQKGTTSNWHFSDVASNAWYASDVQNAVGKGLVSGYLDGSFRPNAEITRQEAAIILAKAKGVSQTDTTGGFNDSRSFPSWSRGYIGAVTQAGVMKGYPDGSFRPNERILRAEAIAALDRIRTAGTSVSTTIPTETQTPLSGTVTGIAYLNKAITYGPASGKQIYTDDVYVKISGTTLKNLDIKGKLIIDREVADGEVILTNVSVRGLLIVRGGGGNSIHISQSQLSGISVEKTPGSKVRLVTIGGTGADVTLGSNASGESLILDGYYPSVTVNADNVNLKLNATASVDNIVVSRSLAGSTIAVASGADIGRLEMNSKSEVSGTGRIREAVVNISGTIFEKTPDKITVKSGVTAPTVTSATGTATDITAFVFSQESKAAVIDRTNHRVTAEVVTGTSLSSLKPTTITLSSGATITPVSGVYQDFRSAVTYTVTAQDGKTKQNWTVTVSVTTLSSATDITAFTLSAQTKNATINTSNHTITSEVLYGTTLNGLKPSITLSSGATISPTSGTAQNFGSTVTYIVTAQDTKTTQAWKVTVTVASSSAANDITAFTISGQTKDAVINKTNHTVVAEVPYGTVLTALKPSITVSAGATIAPTSGTAVDFTTSKTFTVTAQDEKTKQAWTVTVNVASNSAAEIVTFVIPSQSGSTLLSSSAGTAAITMPTGTVLTALTPTITVSADATISPLTSVAQDFSKPVAYTVTAKNGAKKTWIVTVTAIPAVLSSEADIKTFSLTGQTEAPVINTQAGTIGVKVSSDTNLASATPTLTVSTNATINPLGTAPQNFSAPVIYTVTAQNGAKKTWTVTVTKAAAALSNAAAIEKFSISGQVGDAIIDGTNHAITVTMPYNTNRSSLTPSIQLSAGAQISPAATDFSGEVKYTVTAEDTTTKTEWKVNVSNAAASNHAEIIGFSVGGQTAAISGTNITVTLPAGTVITSLAPSIHISDFATVSPNDGVSQDFTNTVSYTVTAQDGTTQTYSVTVTVAAATP